MRASSRSKRRLIGSLIACGILASAAFGSEKPNVILMMADDLGWGDVGFHGNEAIRTPHLDSMAENGLELTRFYTASSICSPTRASVLTGRHPYRSGILAAHTAGLRVGEYTIAEAAKDNGYATGFFGKWHLGWLEHDRPRDRGHYSPPRFHGFDVTFATTSAVPTWDPTIAPWKIWGREKGDPWNRGFPYLQNGKRVTENLEGDDSRIIMDRVIPFIRSTNERGEAFLAIVWFHTPHEPVVAGPEYLAMYSDIQDERQRHYFGAITAMDEQIGRLRHELLDLGIAQDTVLFFTSDNGASGKEVADGIASNGPLRASKHWHYDGGIRVPSLVEWPGKIAPGSKNASPTGTVDYLPTVVDIAGWSMPESARSIPLDGQSFRHALEGRQASRANGIVSGYMRLASGEQGIAYIEGDWKLIRPKNKDVFELYNLAEDPSENNDVIEERPDLAKTMAAKLAAWEAEAQLSRDGADYRY